MSSKINEETWESLSELSIKVGHKIGTVAPLFAKVEESDIEEHKQKLGQQN